MRRWLDKPYYSLHAMLQERFHEKVYKLSLNGGMTCPNRDGTLGTRGCIFCSAGGSGDFAADRLLSVTKQIEHQKALIAKKRPVHKFIAYFQAYTNTYAPVPYLEKLFREAICHPDIVALSIGTRPDCLGDDVLDLLDRLNRIKPVWVELGLQTIHEDTARYIRRGYALDCFEKAVKDLRARSLEVIVHTILGLPGEDRERTLQTIRYLNGQPIQGIKLQLLHVLKGTDLLPLYEAGAFQVLSLPEYLELLGNCLRILPQETVIHRLSGDGPKSLLCAPLWSADKRMVLNSIHRYLKEQQIYQGMDVPKTAPTKTADLPSAP